MPSPLRPCRRVVLPVPEHPTVSAAELKPSTHWRTRGWRIRLYASSSRGRSRSSRPPRTCRRSAPPSRRGGSARRVAQRRSHRGARLVRTDESDARGTRGSAVVAVAGAFLIRDGGCGISRATTSRYGRGYSVRGARTHSCRRWRGADHASHGLALGPHFTRASAARHRVAPDSRDPLQKKIVVGRRARVRAGESTRGSTPSAAPCPELDRRSSAKMRARDSVAMRRPSQTSTAACACRVRAGGPGDETPRPGPRLTF